MDRPRPLPRTAWPARSADDGAALDRWLRILLGVFVATLVVEGPLRWAAAASGAGNLPYLRDAIPAGSLLVLFARALTVQRRIDVAVLVAAALLAVHSLVGLVLGLAPLQVALGCKTFLYVVYGMAMWPLVQDRWRSALRVAFAAYAAALAGIALDFAFGPMPWAGIRYDTAFGVVETTKVWWIPGGIPRLAGFSRTSFNAAMVLGLAGLLTMVGVRRTGQRVLVALVTLVAVAATTSKGMLLAFPVAAAWLLWPAGPDERAGRVLVHALCALGLVLPLAAVFAAASGLTPAEWPDPLHSAWERFSRVWPDAFDLLPGGIAGALGAGLGGIGTPQLYGLHPHQFNPGDSLAVFLLVSFGIAGAMDYVLPALSLRRAAASLPAAQASALVALLVVTYGYGLSISMVEETFFATVLGLACGAMAATPASSAS